MKLNFSRLCCASGLALGLGVGLGTGLNAADHQEAPLAASQVIADIGDYYAWHESDQMNLILTFGTFAAAGTTGSYDSNLLYSFHFDTSDAPDGISDLDIHARFAQDPDGNWGVQVMGVGDTPLVGPIETVLAGNGLSVWTGAADDPFFFDLTGFTETTTTGTLAFNPANDDVAGLNVTAIAIQVPVETIKAGGGTLQTWATTHSL